MAGAQEEFGNRLLDGYMANLGMSNRLYPIQPVPPDLTSLYYLVPSSYRGRSGFAIHFTA